MDWINCKECVYFDDCEETENRDGCYFGDAVEDEEVQYGLN